MAKRPADALGERPVVLGLLEESPWIAHAGNQGADLPARLGNEQHARSLERAARLKQPQNASLGRQALQPFRIHWEPSHPVPGQQDGPAVLARFDLRILRGKTESGRRQKRADLLGIHHHFHAGLPSA